MTPAESPNDYSERFYASRAKRYVEITEQSLHSAYTESEHPAVMSDDDLITSLRAMVPPPARGLDVGCGAEARDVAHLFSNGYDVRGVDSVSEVVETANARHPELAGRLSLADARRPLEVSDGSLDFLTCNSVIQHIAPDIVREVVLPSFVRALAPGGVLMLVFKPGNDILKVYDAEYEAERAFALHDESEVSGWLLSAGMELIPPESGRPGGLIHFRDGKKARHVVGYWRKRGLDRQ